MLSVPTNRRQDVWPRRRRNDINAMITTRCQHVGGATRDLRRPTDRLDTVTPPRHAIWRKLRTSHLLNQLSPSLSSIIIIITTIGLTPLAEVWSPIVRRWGSYLFHLDLCAILLQSVRLRAIYFTIKSLLVHYCAPFIPRI